MKTFLNSKKLEEFLASRRASVTVMMAIMAVPVFIAAGVALDYAVATNIKTQASAAADAAALTAVTPAMMLQSSSTAQTTATNMFKAQAALIKGFAFSANNLNVTVTDATTSGLSRKVSVTYTGQVTNAFGRIYNNTKTNFSVASSASRSTAPNIDFYLLLDNSPSMELPATAAGVSAMVSATGCALACHETNFQDSELSVHYNGWGKIDSYTYAENNGITLRIDNVRTAAQSLASTAQSVMNANGASYRLAAYAFNYALTKMQSLTAISSSTVSAITTNIGAMVPPLMANNGILAGGQSYTYPTSSSTWTSVNLASGTTLSNNDAMTDFTQATTQMNSIIPNPGGGTNTAGDTPQAVLMIVTDGVDDVSQYSSSQCSTSQKFSYSNSYGSFTRCQQPINPAMCTTIKNRGIRIAVLYTTYFPVTSNSWYNNTVAPFMSQVPTNLQSCASSSVLYFEVSTGGDITGAMNTLFKNAISTAPHLTQ
jgi:Flp pilus assembly protein TadG